jgi:hypothetical protein
MYAENSTMFPRLSAPQAANSFSTTDNGGRAVYLTGSASWARPTIRIEFGLVKRGPDLDDLAEQRWRLCRTSTRCAQTAQIGPASFHVPLRTSRQNDHPRRRKLHVDDGTAVNFAHLRGSS